MNLSAFKKDPLWTHLMHCKCNTGLDVWTGNSLIMTHTRVLMSSGESGCKNNKMISMKQILYCVSCMGEHDSWRRCGERIPLNVGGDILSNFGGRHFVDVKCYNVQAILEVSGCFFFPQNKICQFYKMYFVTVQLIYACSLAPIELLCHVCDIITMKTWSCCWSPFTWEYNTSK
jgi:hypothetical protein